MNTLKKYNEFNMINERVLNWKYKIKIKDLFTDDDNPDKSLIIKLCDRLIPQLKSIINEINKSDITEDEIDYYTNKLEEIVDDFNFLKELANGEIKEEEWGNYGFDGDFKEMFNNYLTELYDIGDEQVELNNGDFQKFIWVE